MTVRASAHIFPTLYVPRPTIGNSQPLFNFRVLDIIVVGHGMFTKILSHYRSFGLYLVNLKLLFLLTLTNVITSQRHAHACYYFLDWHAYPWIRGIIQILFINLNTYIIISF